MPFSSMPKNVKKSQSHLSGAQKRKWQKVYEKAKKEYGSKETGAKVAWSAVHEGNELSLSSIFEAAEKKEKRKCSSCGKKINSKALHGLEATYPLCEDCSGAKK